jgi:ubiquinone/menaquinone biosynthesis C-methylase UbiE
VPLPDGLDPAAAKAVYDRIGKWQDTQRFFEDRALAALLDHGRFATARSVLELGCGTGRLAHRLLASRLPADARYLGLEVSTTMARLARRALEAWPERAAVRQTDGSLRFEGRFDRFVACYVFDLLPAGDIRRGLEEARRVLAPDGLACLASLTHPQGPLSRALALVCGALYRISPKLLGGCRPIGLREFLPADRWTVEHHEIFCVCGVCTEVVVTAPRT